MSEDKRKNLRTQGRFSDDRGPRQNSRDKDSKKESKNFPRTQHSGGRNGHQKQSMGHGSKNGGNEYDVKYKENSSYTFSQLASEKKPTEIKKPGELALSTTENGISRIIYKPDFINTIEGYELFTSLERTTKWCEKIMMIDGIEVAQPRLVAWYGPLPYSYSGVTLKPEEMPPAVLNVKKKVEEYLHTQNIHVTLNSVLLNLYRNGKDSVAWHSDDELSMGISPTIASVSLGEVRKFEMRRKQPHLKGMNNIERAEFFVHLKHGSLIVMDGCMQSDWEHRVPKEYHDKSPRINLTFRTVFPLDKLISQSRRVPTENLPVSAAETFSLADESFPSLHSPKILNNFSENLPETPIEGAVSYSSDENNIEEEPRCDDIPVPTLAMENLQIVTSPSACDMPLYEYSDAVIPYAMNVQPKLCVEKTNPYTQYLPNVMYGMPCTTGIAAITEPVYVNASGIVNNNCMVPNPMLGGANNFPNPASFNVAQLVQYFLNNVETCDYRFVFTLIHQIGAEWDTLNLSARDKREIEVYHQLSQEISMQGLKILCNRICEIITQANQPPVQPNQYDHHYRGMPTKSRGNGNYRAYKPPPRYNR